MPQEPERASEGLGGTYFFKDEAGCKVAIVKPCDEEPLAPNNPKVIVCAKISLALPCLVRKVAIVKPCDEEPLILKNPKVVVCAKISLALYCLVRKVAIMKPCDEEPLAPNNPKVPLVYQEQPSTV